jgi:hypothetical protein
MNRFMKGKDMSIWTSLRPITAAVAVALLLSGCVVVVDGEHGEDADWDVRWGSAEDVRRQSPAQDELAREVSGRIAADDSLAGQDITVSAREGVVTLHGRVDSVAALERAMDVASGAPGVKSVVSRLTVAREAS